MRRSPICTKVGGDLEFINFIKGSHFLGDFFPPQFWDFCSAFLFRGLKHEGGKEGRKEGKFPN